MLIANCEFDTVFIGNRVNAIAELPFYTARFPARNMYNVCAYVCDCCLVISLHPIERRIDCETICSRRKTIYAAAKEIFLEFEGHVPYTWRDDGHLVDGVAGGI